MMRKPVIAGNWKMHKTLGESVATALELKATVGSVSHCEVIIAPVFLHLRTVIDRLEGSSISVAAQNVAESVADGAFTGEVSARMLKDVGCKAVIVGHSERRQLFGETDQSVNRKVHAVVRENLTAILCVGETLSEREKGEQNSVVGRQLESGLSGLTSSEVDRIIIAYEPVWAIGTGVTASPQQAQEMHGVIRSTFSRIFGATSAAGLRILYGGSVKPENISELMKQPDIDGALVGGASLEADSFSKLVGYPG
jgi:triosephosphate isomerase (TIM)